MKSIVEAVATINEREFMINFLDQLSEKMYSSSFDVKSAMDDVPQRALGIVSEIFTSAFSKGRETLVREIEKARDDLENLPIVTLTTTIEPTEDFVWKIKNWFLENNGQNVLVDFKIDKSLIGGAIIESGGYRTEYSFRKYFAQRKEKN